MSLYVPTEQDKKLYEGMSVCVVTPVGGYNVWAKYAKCLANMLIYSWMHGLKIYQYGHTEREVVDWARNNLARAAREAVCEYTGQKFTHILWLDDDQVFNPDLAVYLARHGDKDMVSAVYYGRTKPLPVVYVKDTSDDEYKHFPLIEVPEKLVEVDAVGFGSILTRRDVFERVPEPWFTLDWKAGEDIAFCVKAKKYGVRVWVDGTYQLGHIGDPVIQTHASYKRHLEENPHIYADRQKVALGGKHGT